MNNSITMLFAVTVLFFGGCASTQQNISPLPVSNEATFLEGIEGKGDRYLAWGIGENNTLAEEDALKAGLYAAMCGGATGNATPIMNTGERMKHQDFIEGFFSRRGEWAKFVQSSNQGRIDPDKRIRLDDGQVKLGVDIIVDRKGLREYLEYMNVIGGMRIGK